jgi:Tfp pilus assembly ATPase PilU
MRQDPNVIFVGEIATGKASSPQCRLPKPDTSFFTTLHADSSAQAIGRIREYYPAIGTEQHQCYVGAQY